MNPSNQGAYETHSKSPPVLQPIATGVPVDPTNQFYDENPQYPLHLQPLQPAYSLPWSTGLWDCCSDVPNCCITYWCPCITFGQIAEIADEGTRSCVTSGAIYALFAWLAGCGWIYSCFYRSKIRQQYMLKESPCNDCLVHCCCETCALCQEYRELKNHGFDMSMGWQGNLERRNTGVPTTALLAPMLEGGMSR